MRTLWALLALGMLSVWPVAAHAEGPKNATNFGRPLTLNSVNYAPSETGIPTGDYDGDCTANLVLTSGTLSVNVEGKLEGGGFVNMGTLTTSSLVSLSGPIQYVRFNVTACSSCLATAVLRCRVGE